jgi:hypothetical protein
MLGNAGWEEENRDLWVEERDIGLGHGGLGFILQIF